ncbi:MAG: carboxypeptidase-like regulatory domain-containing protein [Bacteroidetes bacterium]|nr:carboxypeptidase-like regulatory domain-containing protein [Bacteroidota bacterium]
MKTFFRILMFVFLLPAMAMAQQPTQVVRGMVIDKESHAPLELCTVILMKDSNMVQAVTTDLNGVFRMEGIPLGRFTILAMYLGYQRYSMAGIIVNSGKEVVLNIQMEPNVVTQKEVVITGNNKGKVKNEMGLVSVKVFTVEETNRYAGSRSDPARMASNFAGVQGANDSRNDIVVRGNSPLGVLYRLDDVDIPNPNHFSVPGTTGGALSILNNKILDNSDFITGAFPADYGNGNAGVFDLKMRNGNNQKHEFTGQLGLLGTELTGEGPINKKTGSSYLAMYRYSTFQLFNALNIKIGTDAVPKYQDGAFRLNFPLGKNDNISLWGIGGFSTIAILVSGDTAYPKDIYAQKDRDQYFNTSMGTVAATYSHIFNTTTYTKLTLSYSRSNSTAHHDLYRDSTGKIIPVKPFLGYNFNEDRAGASWFISKRIGGRQSLKAGFTATEYFYNFLDSIKVFDTGGKFHFQNRWDYKGNALLLQPYITYKYYLLENLVFTAGLHGMISTLNNHYAIEPRAGLKWSFTPNQSLSLAYGMHSQMLPSYIYFIHAEGNTNRTYNKNLDFSKSQHFVLGYDNKLLEDLRLHSEIYYQSLNNIPVDAVGKTSFSVLNQGSAFSRFFPDSLTNKGTGYNQGAELTLEKLFSHNYFLMFTASVYDSKYKGSDGILHNTDFNGVYATNLLAGREFYFGNNTITLGAKITYAGGRRYGIVDTPATRKLQDIVYSDSKRNEFQYPNYFRTDLKIGYKYNAKKVTHEIAIDLVNLTGQKNLLGFTYAPDPRNPKTNPIIPEYQLGFLPLFYYKVDF